MPSGAEFDANAVVQAQELPVLKLGRLRYEGRLLSIEEWLPFWERWQAIRREQNNPKRTIAFYRDYLRAVFPRSRYRFWAPDPVDALFRQPSLELVTGAVMHFFFLQARAMGAVTPEMESAPSTNGTDSLSSIPDEAAIASG